MLPVDFLLGLLCGALVTLLFAIVTPIKTCQRLGWRCGKARSLVRRSMTLISPQQGPSKLSLWDRDSRTDSMRTRLTRTASRMRAGLGGGRKLLLAEGEAEALPSLGVTEMPALAAGCTGEFWNTKSGQLALHTCAELYATELQFAQDLRVALRLYRDPLAPTLTAEERKAVFCNMQELVGLSSELLNELQRVGDPIEVVATAFGRVAPFFMLYGSFCTNYDLALSEVGRLRREISALPAWMQAQSQSAEAKGLMLESFLIKPIQRLTKYHLFFDTLLKSTGDGQHHAFKALAGAATLVRTVSAQVNVKAADLSRRAHSVLSDLGEAWLPLLSPHTQLLLEWTCTLEPKPQAARRGSAAPPPDGSSVDSGSAEAIEVNCYLFSDFLLVCHDEAKGPAAAWLLSTIDRVTVKTMPAPRPEPATRPARRSILGLPASLCSGGSSDGPGGLFATIFSPQRSSLGSEPCTPPARRSILGRASLMTPPSTAPSSAAAPMTSPPGSPNLAGARWGKIKTATRTAAALQTVANETYATGARAYGTASAAPRAGRKRGSPGGSFTGSFSSAAQQTTLTMVVEYVPSTSASTCARFDAAPISSVETFELTFRSAKQKEEARRSILNAKAAEREAASMRERHREAGKQGAAAEAAAEAAADNGAGGDGVNGGGADGGASGGGPAPPKLRRQDSDRSLRRQEVVKLLVAALREDRLAVGTGGSAKEQRAVGVNLKRACRELAHTRSQERRLTAAARPVKAVQRELRLHQLMGRWYVLCSMGDEDAGGGCRNAVEDYEWDGKAGVMRITLSYEVSGKSGATKTVTTRRTGWCQSIETCAEWNIKGLVSGVSLAPRPLLVMECDVEYSLMMLGDPNRSLLKILGRQTSSLGDGVIDHLLQLARNEGYDVSALEFGAHDDSGGPAFAGETPSRAAFSDAKKQKSFRFTPGRSRTLTARARNSRGSSD